MFLFISEIIDREIIDELTLELCLMAEKSIWFSKILNQRNLNIYWF